MLPPSQCHPWATQAVPTLSSLQLPPPTHAHPIQVPPFLEAPWVGSLLQEPGKRRRKGCVTPSAWPKLFLAAPRPDCSAWLLRAAEQMLQCPQPGLHLIRGRNEPFQQWSQAGKALGSVQSLVVVSEGRLSTHQRGFGCQNCSTRRALRENGFRLGWEKQLGREKAGTGLGQASATPRASAKVRGLLPLQCPSLAGVSPAQGR